ncbi:MAG: deoxyribonuclease IV [Actinobacteria bacterium]|nr:deoxyribonuclease IV [Actinomycetota bacterium]
MRPLIGAHVPVAGGLLRGVEYADRVGAEVIQIFAANARRWGWQDPDPVQDVAFQAGTADRGVPVFVHASYLINVGSADPAIRRRSLAALTHAVDRAADLGARGVVVHTGSAVGAARNGRRGCLVSGPISTRLRDLLLPVLDRGGALGLRLLVEPTAGGGTSLASRVEHLGPYFDALDRHPALGVCLDTCHLWAAGHDLAADGGLAATLDALVEAVGPDRVGLVHANGSRDGLGSGRDRHESLAAGMLDTSAFRQLLANDALREVPVVVETATEGHRADIALLKGLRDGLAG